MAKTAKNILDEARSTIKQIGIDEARTMIDKPGTVLVDVRESDEWRQGHIPQAVAIPRGFLELRIEEKVPDHKTPVILQCASGTRSLLAARSTFVLDTDLRVRRAFHEVTPRGHAAQVLNFMRTLVESHRMIGG